MLVQCWASIGYGGTELYQSSFNRAVCIQWRIQELTNGGGRRFFQKNIPFTASLVCSGGVRGHAPTEKIEI